MVVLCAGCERPIQDRFLLNVLDRTWHAKCVACADCRAHLTEKCFSRDGKLYCREDFFRRFGTKCGGCGQGISPNDLVRRARNKVFHLKCFTCMVCRKQLSTGEELYVLDENKFICKEDYINRQYQGSDTEDNDMDFDQGMLDKVDDGLSDKSSTSLPDDDSRDSGLPSLTNCHPHNGQLPPSHPLVTPTANGTLSAATPMDALSPGATMATLIPPSEIKQEKNNNTDSGSHDNKSGSVGCPSSGDEGSNHNDSITGNNNVAKETHSNKENNDKENSKEGEGQATSGTKRRGPRTTIKAKQLETLKAAFAATPKPTRHIREQLAQETGLNMRVIQVWFQNRRSKERRMKQLSALGARRQFFRTPRRLRALRPGEDMDNPDLMGPPGFGYFGDGEFYPGFPAYGDYFPGQQGPPEHGGMTFLPPSGHQGNPSMLDQPVPGQMPPGHDGPFGLHGDMGMPPSPGEPHMGGLHPDGVFGGQGVMPPRSMSGPGFNPGMPHPSQEMAGEVW